MEGEKYTPTPEDERRAEEMMTPTQRELSEKRANHMEDQGSIVMVEGIYSSTLGSDQKPIPQEFLDRWPNITGVAVLSGETRDGRKIRIAQGYGKGRANDRFMATINGKEVPPGVAEQLYNKYSEESVLYSEHPAKLAQADREVDAEYAPAGNVAEEELWKDLL